MPLYEFECANCRREWEVLCKYSELESLQYSLCHGCSQPCKPKLSKTAPPIFNAPGFYQTDYKKKVSE